ncbi:RNA polymerase subunit sigma-70 [Lentilactobacillus buchneri]|nr:RNA polymerase subunit sigma-70 [Lentilactobacillus sp. Egmn17]
MLPNNRLELIRQTAKRNEEAFAQLFHQYYPIDLIRTNNAQKRVPVEPLTSFEANEYFYAAKIADNSASSPIDAVIVDDALRKLYSSCSPLEKRAFNLMLSENGYADLDPKAQRGIINAFERCRRKFDGEIN